jgi:copper(I)-binding protein
VAVTVVLAMVGTVANAGTILGQVAGLDGSAAPPMATMAPVPTMEPMPTMGPGLLVHDAWTRETPMVDLAGAVFLTIENTTTGDDALIGASSPAADSVELHRSAMSDDGVMSMTPVRAVPIPAGGTAVLKPGSYHLMLFGLAEPLLAGGSINVTLLFEHTPPRMVSAPVRPVGPEATKPMDGSEGGPNVSPGPDAD